MARNDCPICRSEAESDIDSPTNCAEIRCPKCGHFFIGGLASSQIQNWTGQQLRNLSGWIRENQGFKIVSSNLQHLGELRNLNVGEKADKIIDYLAIQYSTPGEKIELLKHVSLELEAVSRSSGPNELDFLLGKYLCATKDFLTYSVNKGGITGRDIIDSFYQISPNGWAYIDSKRQANPNSQIGFIAMCFDTVLDNAWMAIHKGIDAAGFEPFRVGQKPHNNRIDDEIIAGIRRSKFLVADLTRHRSNVYYETGFAMGLGLEVFWSCRQSDKENIPFDIRQYNCIFWEDEKLADFSKALKDSIEARFGHGPINEAAGP